MRRVAFGTAVAVALLLTACSPGTLAPEVTTSPPAASTQTRPSASATPTPEPEPVPGLLVTLAAAEGLAVVDPAAEDALLATIEVGQAP